MRKKDITVLLSLMMISGFTVRDIHDYNSQSQALLKQKVDLEEYKTIYERVNEIVDECEEDKRKAEELRAEKERIRLEEERKRQEEEERQRQEELRRQQEEQVRLEQERAVVNRGGDVSSDNVIYCKFEVSFYTTSPDEGSGTGLGASGERVIPWQSIALPKEIPFYSEVYIEGLGTFINHDTGSYISSYYDEQGNKVYRCDVLVNSKEEAYSLGRQYKSGYIKIKN